MGGVTGGKVSGFPSFLYSFSFRPQSGGCRNFLMEPESCSSIKMSLKDKALSGCWLPGIYPLGCQGLLIWQTRTQREVLTIRPEHRQGLKTRPRNTQCFLTGKQCFKSKQSRMVGRHAVTPIQPEKKNM